jgi:hypothetical protein
LPDVDQTKEADDWSGVTHAILLADGTTYRAGFIDPLRTPFEIFSEGEADPIWLCGVFMAFGRAAPDLMKSSIGWEYWLSAPDWCEAARRLQTSVLERVMPPQYDCEWITLFDSHLKQAFEADPVMFCSVDTPTKRFIGSEYDRRESGEAYFYVAIQRLVRGYNDRWPDRAEAYRRRAQVSLIEEDLIRRNTPQRSLPFQDLPAELTSQISRARSTGCWVWDPDGLWNGRLGTVPDDYGEVRFKGKNWRVHRLIYILSRGAIPEGSILRHMCHRKRCCNPDHLIPGSHRQNQQDTIKRKHRRTRQPVRLNSKR